MNKDKVLTIIFLLIAVGIGILIKSNLMFIEWTNTWDKKPIYTQSGFHKPQVQNLHDKMLFDLAKIKREGGLPLIPLDDYYDHSNSNGVWINGEYHPQ